jgi:hypothetical protein
MKGGVKEWIDEGTQVGKGMKKWTEECLGVRL